ncbi:MAG: hypothetical protein AAFR96_05675 [Planctomycetota bacterium]
MKRNAVVLGALGIAGLVLPGCTGVEPAAIGVGLSTAEAGIAFFDGVDVRSFELVRYEDAVAAADRAAEVLSIELDYVRRPGESWEIRNYQLRGRAVLFLEIREESASVTKIRTEARTNLQRGMAALLQKQIFVELQRADAFLEDWAGTTDDARLIPE